MLGFFFLNSKLSEWVIVQIHVALIDGLVDERTYIPQMLPHGIDLQPQPPEIRTEIRQVFIIDIPYLHIPLELPDAVHGGVHVLLGALFPAGLLHGPLGKLKKSDIGRDVPLDGILEVEQRWRFPLLPESDFDGLQFQDLLVQHGIELERMGMVTDLRGVAVPLAWCQVEIGGDVKFPFVEIGFYLHQCSALLVELLLSVVDQTVSYLFYHAFFSDKGKTRKADDGNFDGIFFDGGREDGV